MATSLSRIASIQDFRAQARAFLPRPFLDYLEGGAGEEATLRANEADFAKLALRQRVLRDVSECNTSLELFGQPMSLPVALAPVGFAGAFAARGEVQAARAAAKAGVPFCESTVSICSLEEVAANAPPPWFQLYLTRDRGFTRQLMQRARQADCPVLLLTVDLPVTGSRRREVRNGMEDATSLRGRLALAASLLRRPRWLWKVGLRGRPLGFGNLAEAVPGARDPAAFRSWVANSFDPTVTWRDLDWVREQWPGPLVLKGILDPEDARTAAEMGVEGIVVSNHGGRQLDGAPSAIAALPAVAAAAGDRMAVLMDGGVRSGADILRALALGARACLVGRPWGWALAAGGEAGVARMLAILAAELRTAMALTGCTELKDIDSRVLV